MPDDFTNQVIAELAKQIPAKEIYGDLASSTAQEIGSASAELVKVLHLALAPIQFLAAVQDRYRAFLDRSIRRVPVNQRVAPAPQILGPIIEALRYEPEDTPIDEMFSQLLTSSMHTDRVALAHPAFPNIVRQLSADEARIISLLAKQNFDRVSTRDFDFDTHLFAGKLTREIDAFPRAALAFPSNINLYIDHLHTLGLAGLSESKPQQAIMGPDNRFPDDPSRQVQTGIRIFQSYQLTDWGSAFHAACSEH